jgi:hypothetical protein
MPIYKDTVMVKDKFDREVSVAVTVRAPDDVSAVNVQELAQQAWQSPGKEIRLANGVRVKVRASRRWPVDHGPR